MQRKTLFLCLIFTLAFLQLSEVILAQNKCEFVIEGWVLDEHDGQPLQQAQVYIEGKETVTYTDSSGKYILRGVCKGRQIVICKHIGCEDISKKVFVRSNMRLNFKPEHHAHELHQATVARKKQSKATVGAEVLESSIAEQKKGVNLAASLEEMNGIRTLKTGNNIAKPVINGLHSNRIQLLNNGVRQEGQQWGSEHAPAVDAFTAEEIVVVKGAKSIQYGAENIGGLIITRPKGVAQQSGIRADVSTGFMSNGRQGFGSIRLESRFKKRPQFYWAARGTLKRGGNIHSPSYHLKNTGIYERAYSGFLGYKSSNLYLEFYHSNFMVDLGVFSAAHIGNLSDLRRAFEASEPIESADFTYAIERPRQSINHSLYKLEGFYRIKTAGRLRFQYSYQDNSRKEFDKHRPLNDSLAGLDRAEFDLNLGTHLVDANFSHTRYKNVKGAAGISLLHQENIYSGRFFLPNYRKKNMGVYWFESWQNDSANWVIDAGIRYDNIEQQVFIFEDGVLLKPNYNFAGTALSLNITFKPKENSEISLNFGQSWRPPGVNEQYSDGVHHGAAAVELGDINLKQEEVKQISLSVDMEVYGWRINGEGYYKLFDNFINLNPILPPTLTIRGAFPTYRYQQSDAKMYGSDFQLSRNINSHLALSLRGSILRAEDEESEFIQLMPADRYSTRLTWKPRDRKAFNQTQISLDWVHVMKQTRVDDGHDFEPPDAYSLVNLSFTSKITAGSYTFDLGLSVNNALNTSYRDYLDRFRYYTNAMGRNIGIQLKLPINIK